MESEILVALIGGISGLIISLITSLLGRKRFFARLHAEADGPLVKNQHKRIGYWPDIEVAYQSKGQPHLAAP